MLCISKRESKFVTFSIATQKYLYYLKIHLLITIFETIDYHK